MPSSSKHFSQYLGTNNPFQSFLLLLFLLLKSHLKSNQYSMAKPLEFTPAIHARILKCIKENIILPIGRNNESLNPEWGIPFQTETC